MDLTEDELKALQDRLNVFEAHDVHAALQRMEARPLGGHDVDTGTVASGPLDFGSMEPGVLVYRLDRGKVRVRITVSEMTGGYYDELEVSDATVRGLVDALVARLGDEGAPRAS